MDHIYSSIGGWFNFSEVYERMVKQFPDNSHFIEVGAWQGKSTSFMIVEIINSNKKIKFDVVDTWEGSSEHQNDEMVKQGKLYETFLNNLKDLEDHFTPLKMTSIEASKLYADKSLDFVFIDAAHDYESVKQDINHWLPKIKNGGFIGGDDYNFEDVKRAVNEILGQDNVESVGSSWPSWLYNIRD
jgi:hypothetical protein